ncbi:MAG: PadR family transcriptional regulator [Pseudomonadota bacterium]
MSLHYAIMTALLDGERTGYDLAKQFDVSLGFFWTASHQQIYRALKELSRDGLIEVNEIAQAGKPDKRSYRLTDAGHDALNDWVLKEGNRTPPQRDELFVRLYNLSSANRAELITAVKERATSHADRLALYERIRDRHYSEPARLRGRRRGVYLALLAGIHKEQAGLSWAEAALAYLGAR